MLSENDFLFDYITKKDRLNNPNHKAVSGTRHFKWSTFPITKKECLVLKFLEEFLFLKSVSIIINYAIFF